MDRFLRLFMSVFQCRTPRRTLAVLWTFGALAGSYISLSADKLLASTMHSALESGLSITGLLTMLFFPLLFTAFAVFIPRLGLLYPVVFLKAFLFSYTGAGLLFSLNSSGWLLWFLLMFSEMLILPVLWFLWLQIASGRFRLALYSALPAVFIAFLTGFLDYSLVAPFLADLVTF